MINQQVLNATTLLRALKDEPGIKLKDFCDSKKLSKHFMEQIGRKLVQSKIIISRRGPGGGYILNRKEVSLSELVKLFKTIKSTKDPLVVKTMNALNEINVLE